MKNFNWSIIILLAFISCRSEKEVEISFNGSQNINLTEVLIQAEQTKKNVLLYFSGLACVNCRYMEQNVLTDKSITRDLMNDFIFIPLNVDDRTILPDDKWIHSDRTGKLLTTIAEINSDLQIELTQSGSQPFLAIIDNKGTILRTANYSYSIEEFELFLNQ